MPSRRAAACLLALFVALPASAQPTLHRHHHRAPVAAAPPRVPGCRLEAYGGYSCYDDAGNPYEPDIIGGPNHVGEGGPAANFY